MAISVCLNCNSEFYIKPSHLSRGWGKYCSITCRNKGRLQGRKFSCSTCGLIVYRAPLAIKRSKSGLYFCSKVCQTHWRNKTLFSGENHPNWKTGESAYRRILKAASVKQMCVLCETKDSRILAVHHRDKNRDNNKIANLIWLCHNCHYLIHHYRDQWDKLEMKITMVDVAQQ